MLVTSLNDRWHKTFTSSSDRYPLRVEIPPEFLHPEWNHLTGHYTNVALTGRNDASVEYRLFLGEREIIHVVYRVEVQPQTFTIHFKDTFSLRRRSAAGRKTQAQSGASGRFKDFMEWTEPPAESTGSDSGATGS